MFVMRDGVLHLNISRRTQKLTIWSVLIGQALFSNWVMFLSGWEPKGNPGNFSQFLACVCNLFAIVSDIIIYFYGSYKLFCAGSLLFNWISAHFKVNVQ